MKGLLIKDFQILKGTKNLMVIALGIPLIFLILGKETLTFLVSFITLIASMLVLTTISYDEFNNGNAFLMTLPVTRKGYVREKYCFGIGLSLTGWVLSSVIATVATMIQTTDNNWVQWWLSLASLLGLGLLFMAVTIPVQLKFGGDKGRIALLAAIACAFIVGWSLAQAIKMLHLDLRQIFNQMAQIGLPGIVGILLIALLVLLGISYSISVKIMEKKQF